MFTKAGLSHELSERTLLAASPGVSHRYTLNLSIVLSRRKKKTVPPMTGHKFRTALPRAPSAMMTPIQPSTTLQETCASVPSWPARSPTAAWLGRIWDCREPVFHQLSSQISALLCQLWCNAHATAYLWLPPRRPIFPHSLIKGKGGKPP